MRAVLEWHQNGDAWATEVSRSGQEGLLEDAGAGLRISRLPDGDGGTMTFHWLVVFNGAAVVIRPQGGASYDLTRAMVAAEETAHVRLLLPYQYVSD